MFKMFQYSVYPYLAQNTIFIHFNVLQANLRSGKGGAYTAGPGRRISSLRHCDNL